MTVVALGMAWAGYRFGPTMLMSAARAREIETPSTDEERRLVNVRSAAASHLDRSR
jgi:hypothetical protein